MWPFINDVILFSECFPIQYCVGSSQELCDINRAAVFSSLQRWRSWDPKMAMTYPSLSSGYWYMDLNLGPLTSLALFILYSVAVSLLLDCFWKNCKVFSLCILQNVHQLSHSCHYKDSPNELCISIWLKKRKIKGLGFK